MTFDKSDAQAYLETTIDFAIDLDRLAFDDYFLLAMLQIASRAATACSDGDYDRAHNLNVALVDMIEILETNTALEG